METCWELCNVMLYDAHWSKSVTHKPYKLLYWSLDTIAIHKHPSVVSMAKLSMDGYLQTVWHQSDLSWQLRRYKKKCEGRSVFIQGWVSWVYVRVKLRYKIKPTTSNDAVNSFTTNLLISNKHRWDHLITKEGNYSRGGVARGLSGLLRGAGRGWGDGQGSPGEAGLFPHSGTESPSSHLGMLMLEMVIILHL